MMRWAPVLLLISKVVGWQRWPYKSNTTAEWKALWPKETGPGERRGHTMVLDNNQILLFGGRSNEVKRRHVPMTYEIEDVEGVLDFVSYDGQPVLDEGCQTVNGTCENEVDVGLYFNDMWSYELDCTRYGDEPCVDRTWQVLNVGARRGGCQIVLGREICTHPSERWLHGAAMFDDATMLVYGGFSQRCEDYCDDLWAFDIRDSTWMEIYEIGFFSSKVGPGKRWKFSIVGDGTQFFVFGGFRLWHGFADDNSEENRWSSSAEKIPDGGYLQDFWVYKKRLLGAQEPMPTSSASIGNWSEFTQKELCEASPGATWADRDDVSCEIVWPQARAGHVAALDEDRSGMWVFGGYTTYFPYLSTDGRGSGPGVSTASSYLGGFRPYVDYPFYLNDLWFYNFTSLRWRLVEVQNSMTSKPEPRMDHVAILDGRILIVVGGFNGSHHFDDTWYFNTTSDRWLQKKSAVYPLWPASCTDDYANTINVAQHECFELDPKRGVIIAPANPVREFCGENSGESGCPGNDWYEPDDENPAFAVFDNNHHHQSLRPAALKYRGVPFYGVGDADSGWPKNPAGGQPIAPFAATGPRQFVWGAQWWDAAWVTRHEEAGDIHQYFLNETMYNDGNGSDFLVLEGVYYRRCTSAFGEPTRGRVLDGKSGRATADVHVAQPRRRAPLWDGCRDVCFGITHSSLNSTSGGEIVCPEDVDLTFEHANKAGLQYLRPNQRSDHAAVHASSLSQVGNHRKGEVYIYGGVGFTTQHAQSVRETQTAVVMSDMWRLGIHDCERNCSLHGDCFYGFCRCYPGFYGADCSNTSCPGDFCYVDEATNEQVCQHCCQAGYNHSDSDHRYRPDLPKVPCTSNSKRLDGTFGESNGICDGFGTCQCAPPYLMDDCSVKDCKHNCSGRGNCSVEFPNSRCLCNPGYYGEHCQWIMCLNNCSYPNGHCDPLTGACTCEMMYSPYNNTRKYFPWDGEDCSYLAAYCAACALKTTHFLFLALCLLVTLSLALNQEHDDDHRRRH